MGDLAELRKNMEGKNKTITGIKVKVEKAPGRLTAAKNTTGNITDTNGRCGWRMECGKTYEIKQKKRIKRIKRKMRGRG